MPKRMGSAVPVSSGITARLVTPIVTAPNHAVAIHGAALVAMSLSHRANADPTRRTARPTIGNRNSVCLNTSSRTACAAMIIRTIQATAEARRSRDERKRAIAS
jgi:hypothetical protein